MIKVILSIVMIFVLAGCNPVQEASSPAPQRQTPQALFEEGLNYLVAGNVEKSIESFQKVLVIDPDNIQVYFTLGQIYMKIGAFDNVIVAGEEILKRDQQNGDAYLLIAGAYDMKGEQQQAIDAVKLAIQAYQQKQNLEGMQQALAILQQLTNGAQ